MKRQYKFILILVAFAFILTSQTGLQAQEEEQKVTGIEKKDSAKDLVNQAKILIRKRDYLKAKEKLEAALEIDPFRLETALLLDAIDKRLTAKKVRPDLTPKPIFGISEKLEMFIPKVEFKEAKLKTVLDYLAAEADLNIVIDPLVFMEMHPSATIEEEETETYKEEREGIEEEEEETEEPSVRPLPAPYVTDRITISLKNVPLKAVLKYVLRYKGLKYIVEDYAIVIVPIDYVPKEDLQTEIFRLTTSGLGTRELGTGLGIGKEIKGY